MKTSTALAIFAALLIIGGGTWWYLSQNSPAPQGAVAINSTNTTTSDNTQSAGQQASTTAAQTVTINFTAQGFNPDSVTINKGDTVTFVSTDGSPMWIGSNVHPTHSEYDGTSRATHCAPGYAGPAPFDECGTGSTYSFTFTKTGTFGFHNHVASQFQGTVIVK